MKADNDNHKNEIFRAANSYLQRARDAGAIARGRTDALIGAKARLEMGMSRDSVIQFIEDAIAEETDRGMAVAHGVDTLVNAAHGAAVEAGWWQDLRTGEILINAPRIIPEKLCLIHSEISEAMEGHRKGLMDDKLPHRTMLEVELADAVIRIGDLAGMARLNLGDAVAEKMAFNENRPDHKPAARLASGGKAF